MTPKIVANFRRSLSFPNHPSSSSTSKPNKKAFHVRSTSLPCRSHPLIFQLNDQITELKTWAVSRPGPTSSSWICDGLTRLKSVHKSLDDLLHLPQNIESFSGHSKLIEKFLEDFLHFVDVYGIFQSLILRLKEDHSAAQVALRKRDDSKIAFYLKNIKILAKEIRKLVALVQCIGKYSIPDGDAELACVIRDVIEATVLVSVTVFNGLFALLSSSSSRKLSRMGLIICLAVRNNNGRNGEEEGIEEVLQNGWESLWKIRKRGEEEMKMISKRMNEMEDCIDGIEIGSERAFRSLISTRVSLLNLLTH